MFDEVLVQTSHYRNHKKRYRNQRHHRNQRRHTFDFLVRTGVGLPIKPIKPSLLGAASKILCISLERWEGVVYLPIFDTPCAGNSPLPCIILIALFFEQTNSF